MSPKPSSDRGSAELHSSPPLQPVEPTLLTQLNDDQSTRFDCGSLEQKRALVMEAIQSELPAAVLAERLGTLEQRNLAEVHRLTIGEADFALKFRHDSLGGGGSAALLNLRRDVDTFSAGLPGVAKLFGIVNDSDGNPVAVLTVFYEGESLTEAVRSGRVTPDQAMHSVHKMVATWAASGYFVRDENPENLILARDNTFVLIDGEAISRTERLARYPDGVVAPTDINGVGIEEDLAALGLFDDIDFDGEGDESDIFEVGEEVIPLSELEVVEAMMDCLSRTR